MILSQYSTGVSIFFCFLLPVLASSLQLFRFLPSCFDFVVFFWEGREKKIGQMQVEFLLEDERLVNCNVIEGYGRENN